MLETTSEYKHPGGANGAKTGADLGRLGGLVTRVAVTSAEIAEAQSVRFRVFCEEHSAVISEPDRVALRESDRHDAKCDHLLIEAASDNAEVKIVGTQRFFLRRPGDDGTEFYSQSEFDVEQLINRHPGKTFMELGRSCILPEYRSKRTMELMWQGTWAYAVENRVDVMIGCASFHTTDAAAIEASLGYLGEIAGLAPNWSVSAVAQQVVAKPCHMPADPDHRKMIRTLPPLIKGYLRLGAMFSSEAVVDHAFGTTDVLVVLPVEHISSRYLDYYGKDASKHRR